MHRVAEAIQACGHEVVLVQEARFHPGWFHSDLPTTDRQSWSARTDLTLSVMVILRNLCQAFLPQALRAEDPAQSEWRLQLWHRRQAFRHDRQGSALYRHPDLQQIWCVSEHDRRLLSLGLDSPQSVKVERLEVRYTTARGKWPTCRARTATTPTW